MRHLFDIDDTEERFPEGPKPILTRGDFVVHQYLDMYMLPCILYKGIELMSLAKEKGVDIALVNAGLPRLNFVGQKYTLNMLGVTDRLWKNGLLRKFAKGIFYRTGRYRGVEWLRND